MILLAIFKIFTGIPSSPVAFLGLKDFIISFISSTFAVVKSKFRVSFWLHLIFKTLGWFLCFKFLTVCSCHVTYAFQSEFTPYSCMNVKELLARSRREILRLSDCNWTQTQNHLVRKRTLNLRTKWFWVRVQLNSLLKFCLQFLHHFLAKRNLQDLLVQYQMFFQLYVYNEC